MLELWQYRAFHARLRVGVLNISGAFNPDINFSPKSSAWRMWEKRIKACRLNAGKNNAGKLRQKQANPPNPP